MGDWQYVAKRLLGDGTETALDWNLPLGDVALSSALSGPDSMSATITPEVASLKGIDGQPLVKPWATALYAVKDGRVRNGCIVTDMRARGSSLTLDGIGFSGYLQGMPYLNNDTFAGVDPFDVVRSIWNYVQSHARGNIGMVVDSATSPRKTGTVLRTDGDGDGVIAEEGGTREGEALVLSWQKTHDLQKVIDDLAVWTPFDYREDHTLNDDGSITHGLRLGYPKLGRRLTDLRFVEGENVLIQPDIIDEGSDYADEILLLGAGEGDKMKKTHMPRQGESRLRRPVVVSDRSLTSFPALWQAARLELDSRLGLPDISEIKLIDHPNAPLGAVTPGDEILLQTHPHGWFGSLSIWLRVLEVVVRPEDPTSIVLSVARVEGV